MFQQYFYFNSMENHPEFITQLIDYITKEPEEFSIDHKKCYKLLNIFLKNNKHIFKI